MPFETWLPLIEFLKRAFDDPEIPQRKLHHGFYKSKKYGDLGHGFVKRGSGESHCSAKESLMRYEDKYRCPKCGTAIFDRAFSICGTCHAELPPELLFSEAEREAMRVGTARSERVFDRIRRIYTAIFLGGLWIGAIWSTWKRPDDWWFLLGGAAAITVYLLIRRWAASRDDGLNPSLRRQTKRPNQPPQRNAGIGPATLGGAIPPRPALSSEETARPQSPRG
jgi:hypothetical protein